MESLEQGRSRIQELAEELSAGMGLELVEVTVVGGRRPRFCVFVDGAEGVTVDQCARISRGISAQIDEEETLFPGPYRLEVSSPGLDRPFVGVNDFLRNLGRKVEAHLKEARPGGIGRLVGTLHGADNESFELALEDGTVERCSFDEVRKVHRYIEF